MEIASKLFLYHPTLYPSGPQPFWHQGPLLGKMIFLWTGGGRGDGLGVIQVLYIHYVHMSLASFCSHFKGKLRLRESNLDYFPRVAQLVHSRAGTWTKFFQHKAYDWRCTSWPWRTSLIPLLPWEVSGLSTPSAKDGQPLQGALRAGPSTVPGSWVWLCIV